MSARQFNLIRINYISVILGLLLIVVAFWATSVAAQNTRITLQMQAIAEAASSDSDIAAFYKANGFKPIWTGNSNRDAMRRRALIEAAKNAASHGLPTARYDASDIRAMIKAAKTARERGALEVELSRVFLQYARDLQTGVLIPSRVDSGIVRQIPYRDRTTLLASFAASNPRMFLRKLAPSTPEYSRLMKEKLRLEKLFARGGWGPKIAASSLKPGASGRDVVAMRNRLIAMGYLKRTSSQTYDENLQRAVQSFQSDHGLVQDGVAGKGTIREMNRSTRDRLKSVIVAMERERWMNQALGRRHILVNLTDFTARIIDNEKVTFQTRAVVGKNANDQRSPEFSDVMEFMVINPTWNVPRSIATKEYLPLLQGNPNAVSHLRVVDGQGRTVSRDSVDFSQYSARNFPFDLKQPPSRGNALGLVKFMFPNPHNIYLHDTPAKNLFNREVRAFSHGCIRLHQPFEFAYQILARQTSDPEAFFHEKLQTGRETRVDLKQPVPVHIIYRTAFTTAKGRTNYRRDIYGRDARIFTALDKAGVALGGAQG